MRNICLLNDTFPPQIDGVANVVENYAFEIEKHYGHAIVVTPEYPGADDSGYPFDVLRYPSIDFTKQLNVVAGLPFNPGTVSSVTSRMPELLHVHCPASTALLARSIRNILDVPLVMTYHTKCDIDIRNVIKMKLISDNVINAMIENISAYDEIWTVSRGAGESLRSLGYKGDYIVMENGVDLPHARVDDETVRKVTSGYDLPENVPVFLFVGRFMWYKGFRILIDALAGLKSGGMDFRMVFVGGGTDAPAIIDYTEKTGIADKCVFTGPIHDRQILRAWYCRANLMLFPSTFDTNGLVVREAASCSLPTVLIKDSCAAEGVTDGRNGYLTDETAPALAVCLFRIMQDPNAVRQVGENAGNELYISWEDAVRKAAGRYETVIDNYKSGRYPKHKRLTDSLYSSLGGFLENLSVITGSLKLPNQFS